MILQLVQGKVEIYEFSRGFKEVQINGKWVSGGFGNAIARSNYKSGLVEEIPEPIRNAVDYGLSHENILGIPTAYNPPEGQVSLIAREIDERYSILAVANKQDEDKGRTEIVGYRYFWLDKYSEINRNYLNMDGVGTLLQWWSSNNTNLLRDIFDMNPSSFRKEKLICNEYRIDSQRYDSTSRNYPIYPAIFEPKVTDLIPLHERAMHESKQRRISLSWAWNVRRLEFPAMYLAIWYTDEAAKKAIELDLQRIGVKNQPISPIIPNTNWIFQRRDRVSLNPDERKVEKFLLDFGFTPSSENANKVIKLIPNINVEWDKFFVKDNQYIKYLENGDNPPKEAVFYAAWEPVIAPQNVVVWLNWLREPQNQKHSSIFLKVHTTIEKVAQKDEKQNEISKLIHEGISSLLAGLLDNQIAYEDCKWLLVDKKDSLWSKEFNKYSDQLLNYLKSSLNTFPNTFTYNRPYTKKLWEDLYENYINKFDPENPENIQQEVSHLANLFRDKFQSEVNTLTKLLNQTNQFQLSVCCLSALFYQYSEGSIPSSVFVPLENYYKRNISKNDNHKNSIFRLLRQEPVERMKWARVTRNISLLVILIIIGIVGSGLFSVYHQVYIYVINPSQLSPVPSLQDIIYNCKNIESNLSSQDKISSQTKEIIECKKQLDELLISEEIKLQKLQDNSGGISESDKISIRLSGTYQYIRYSFVNNYLSSQQDYDRYSFLIVQSLGRSVKKNIKYIDILKNLNDCKAKNSVKEFQKCISELP